MQAQVISYVAGTVLEMAAKKAMETINHYLSHNNNVNLTGQVENNTLTINNQENKLSNSYQVNGIDLNKNTEDEIVHQSIISSLAHTLQTDSQKINDNWNKASGGIFQFNNSGNNLEYFGTQYLSNVFFRSHAFEQVLDEDVYKTLMNADNISLVCVPKFDSQNHVNHVDIQLLNQSMQPIFEHQVPIDPNQNFDKQFEQGGVEFLSNLNQQLRKELDKDYHQELVNSSGRKFTFS